MSDFLSSLSVIDGSHKGPYFGVLYGPGGCGKSWLCSYAEAPFFVPIEPGANLIPAKKFKQRPTHIDQVLDMMRWFIANKDHGAKTVVLDSLGFVEALIYDDIVKKNPTTGGKDPKPVESISDYGFGHGYAKAMTYWERILKGVDALQAAGLNVIFITHSHYRNMPLESGETFKYVDMALQTFGDYSVPELLKRRADWVYYMESKVKTKLVRSQFGGMKTVALAGSEPETTIYTRATSQFYAKVRVLDESSIPDFYELNRGNLAEGSKQIFDDMV